MIGNNKTTKKSTKKVSKPTEHMAEEDKKWLKEIYEYVKFEVLRYDEEQKLSRFDILRIKGLRSGRFVENKNIESTAKYSYETVLNAFKYSMPEINKAWATVRFKDDKHKVNYLFKIVEKNLNTVHLRMKSAKRTEEKMDNMNIDTLVHTGAEYQKKTKKELETLSNLW